MSTGGCWFLRAVRDDAYLTSKHTMNGALVVKELAQGKGVHVFDPGVDLLALEQQVWTAGTYQGTVGTGPRAIHQRFVWRSPTPIGRRMQAGKADIPLHWVEIKGKIVGNHWLYHLAPRTRPAS